MDHPIYIYIEKITILFSRCTARNEFFSLVGEGGAKNKILYRNCMIIIFTDCKIIIILYNSMYDNSMSVP